MIPGGDIYPEFVSLTHPVEKPVYRYGVQPGQEQVADRVTYSRRTPGTKWILGLSLGVLGFITVATVLLTVLLS